ncbi:MAG TPA: hypothetical protein VNJ08_15790 [Bacteriovoracaceae bacterium]|nr:hypothetical protein [Bacteriovoracaceae bacterium]
MKKLKLQFKDVTDSDVEMVESILKESEVSIDYKPFLPDNIKFIMLKEHVCGFLLKNHIVVKHVVLRPHFRDQDLSKDMVESYYFN